MENNKKKNNKKIVVGLFILFLVLLGSTLFVSFSSLLDVPEVRVKSIHAVYDPSSTVVMKQEKGIYEVIFNDKNQTVDYNVVIENTQDYDVQIKDITLSTPTAEFLHTWVDDIEVNDVLKAHSTKEFTVSFETFGIEGWGRNFSEDLVTNITFDKEIENVEILPPVEEKPNEGDKQPEAPATNIEEIIDIESEALEAAKSRKQECQNEFNDFINQLDEDIILLRK
jgi:hypothetical protein